MRGNTDRRAADRGSASIYAAGLGLALSLTGVAIAVMATRAVDAHQAQAAADLGALAGASVAAQGEAAACGRAGAFAAANGAQTVSCRLSGFDLVLTVRVTGRTGGVEATATAGPIRAHAPDPAPSPARHGVGAPDSPDSAGSTTEARRASKA